MVCCTDACKNLDIKCLHIGAQAEVLMLEQDLKMSMRTEQGAKQTKKELTHRYGFCYGFRISALLPLFSYNYI